MALTSTTVLNPRTTHYEFLGPPGALLVTVFVPITAYALYFGCSETSGGCPPRISYPAVIDTLSDPSFWKSLWDTQAALIYLGWYAFCVLAWAILPGDWVEGSQLRDGGKKLYKINGEFEHNNLDPTSSNPSLAFSTFLLALGLTSGYIWRFGPESFTFLYDKFIGFVTASLLMSVVQAAGCYAASFRQGALLALGGNSGNVIYDVRFSSHVAEDV